MAGSLLVVHVHVRVREGDAGAFRVASLANAEASRQEPGVVRFDLLADRDRPDHFVLVEIYRDAAAAAAHKETLTVWLNDTWPKLMEGAAFADLPAPTPATTT